jgi:hypothetical protein
MHSNQSNTKRLLEYLIYRVWLVQGQPFQLERCCCGETLMGLDLVLVVLSLTKICVWVYV